MLEPVPPRVREYADQAVAYVHRALGVKLEYDSDTLPTDNRRGKRRVGRNTEHQGNVGKRSRGLPILREIAIEAIAAQKHAFHQAFNQRDQVGLGPDEAEWWYERQVDGATVLGDPGRVSGEGAKAGQGDVGAFA